MNQKQVVKKVCSMFTMILLVASNPARVQAQEQEVEKSLYERLGGVYSIATVVDDFIERLLVNDILNANPAIKEARDRVPKAGLKYRLTEQVCQVTGGPEKYNGRNMKDSHKHLNITEGQWDAMVADFKKTLDKFEVPEKEQNELLTIIGSTKGDIVMSSTTSKTQ
jgi:hemoglobin